MNNKILYIALVLLALGAIVFVLIGKEKAEITNYPSSGTDIIAFGDSLVEGVGASSPDKTFVSLLSAKIGRPIANLGVSGNTTEMGIARLAELDEYNPKVVLLLLGGNDHLRKVPSATTFENLATIIEDLHRRGAVVVLLGVKGNLFGDRFEPEFKKLAERYRVAYVPNVLDGLFGDTRYMADSIHPNDAGNAIIAERVYPVLAEVLE